MAKQSKLKALKTARQNKLSASKTNSNQLKMNFDLPARTRNTARDAFQKATTNTKSFGEKAAKNVSSTKSKSTAVVKSGTNYPTTTKANAASKAKLLDGGKKITNKGAKALQGSIEYTDFVDVVKKAKGSKDKKMLAYALGYGGAALVAAAASGAFSGDKSKKKSNAAGKTKNVTKTKKEQIKKVEQKPTLQKTKTAPLKKEESTPKQESFNLDTEVKNVMSGKYGTGAARKAALGDNYGKVQAEINKRMAASKPKTTPSATSNTTTTEKQTTPDKAEIRRPGPIAYSGPKELQMTAEQRMNANIDKLAEKKKYGGVIKKKGGSVKSKKK